MSQLPHGMEIDAVMCRFDRSLIPRPMSRSAQPTDWVSGASMMIPLSVLARARGTDENYFLYLKETDFS
jgi:GT2 family glycosyltransferase